MTRIKQKAVIVAITNTNAIYVDGILITKWRMTWWFCRVVAEFICMEDDVISECIHRSHIAAVKNINNKYLERLK
jgi:hypothetical protein